MLPTEAPNEGLASLLRYRHEGIINRFARLHGVSRERAEVLFVETLKWHWLARWASEAPSLGLMLSIYPEIRGIDEMWHVFLLFTRDYEALCEEHNFPVLRKPFLASDVMNQIRSRLTPASAVRG